VPGSEKKLALGIDLGGTKLLVAIVAPDGRVVYHVVAPSRAKEGPDAVVGRMVSASKRVSALAGVALGKLAGVGVAVAGLLDSRRGIVTTSPNLPGWEDTPVREIMAEKLGIPALVVNDADAAAVGEHRFGAGRGTRHMLYITVSTGVGGGIIIDGRLYSGASGCAGEFGHMAVDPDGPLCACGRRGCWEALASGSAIAREAASRLRKGEKSILAGCRRTVTAEDVGKAAQDGDRLAREVIASAARYLGIGLANLVNIFNPEMIVIGGGVSNLGNLLLGPARETIDRQAFPLLAGAVKIVRSQVGAAVGAVGAATLVFERLVKRQKP
jgi:glucokinase